MAIAAPVPQSCAPRCLDPVIVLNGELSFEDATGKRGELAAAGFAWMMTGSLLW